MLQCLGIPLFLFLAASLAPAAPVWEELHPGLDLASFDTRTLAADPQGSLLVLRADPRLVGLHYLAAEGKTGARTVKRWCQEEDLLAAVNAGMYQADRRTHVGFCRVDGRTTNPSPNDYLSAAAWDPIDPEAAPFRIFDLDETPLSVVTERYRTVIQNLRLIKRPGENRWQPSGERWGEAALGEDRSGRVLLIYCPQPLSMHEFNGMLLKLPLDLVAAQHLEGRFQARLWIAAELLPQRRSGLARREAGPVLPNVIGLTRSADHDNAAGGD